jgi:hypothetical protein
MLAAATAVTLAASAAAGASASRAEVGSVYFDFDNDAAAGQALGLFNGTFIGHDNVGLGRSVMRNLTSGSFNVALGQQALFSNTTGDDNVAIGANAGQNLTTGSDSVYIANPGRDDESGAIRIGRSADQTATFIAGISTRTLGGATQPVVKDNGQLGVAPARSASTASLAATVERLQRQVRRLRERVRRG